jgi:hypothetical protein
VVLLLASDVTVSLPLSSDAPARIAALYTEHRTAYLLAQVAGLAGVAVLVRFVLFLRRAPETASRSVFAAGLSVAAVAATTNVPVLRLCLDRTMSSAAVSWTAHASDVTDWVQFATFAAFSAALALRPMPRWMRAWAAGAAVLLAADALTWIWPSSVLAVVAPLSVVVLVAAVSIRMIARHRMTTR